MSSEPHNNRKHHHNKSIKSSQDRSIPFNVSMPGRDLDKLREVAGELGIEKSELIRQALQLFYHYHQPKESERTD